MTFEADMDALKQHLISSVSDPVHPTVLAPWDLALQIRSVSRGGQTCCTVTHPLLPLKTTDLTKCITNFSIPDVIKHLIPEFI
jgi:hypothetical protein